MPWIKCLFKWRRGKRSEFHLCVLARPSASLIHLVTHPADTSDNFFCVAFVLHSFALDSVLMAAITFPAPRFIDFGVILDVLSCIIVSARVRRKR
jgi:hypothetical protein